MTKLDIRDQRGDEFLLEDRLSPVPSSEHLTHAEEHIAWISDRFDGADVSQNDETTRLPHWAHAAWRLALMTEVERREKAPDET